MGEQQLKLKLIPTIYVKQLIIKAVNQAQNYEFLSLATPDQAKFHDTNAQSFENNQSNIRLKYIILVMRLPSIKAQKST